MGRIREEAVFELVAEDAEGGLPAIPGTTPLHIVARYLFEKEVIYIRGL
jgi:hypothetical protein